MQSDHRLSQVALSDGVNVLTKKSHLAVTRRLPEVFTDRSTLSPPQERKEKRPTMSIYEIGNYWKAVIANNPEHTMCFPYWTQLEVHGGFSQWMAVGIPFEIGAQIKLPGHLPATLHSLLSFHKRTSTYQFLARINGSTTFILVENRPAPLMTKKQQNSAMDYSGIPWELFCG
jgi:hypothetical protein